MTKIIKARFHHRRFESSPSQHLPACWLGSFPAGSVADRCIRPCYLPDELLVIHNLLPLVTVNQRSVLLGYRKLPRSDGRIPWKMNPWGRAAGNNIACCGKFYKPAAVTHHPGDEYLMFALEQHLQM